MKMIEVWTAVIVCCAVLAAHAQRQPDIRRISIAEILESNPELKAELTAKIKARQDEPETTARSATTSTTAATTTARTKTTTTSAPQADTPPSTPAETTEPINGRRRPQRRRPAGAESREPRVRVVPDGEAAPQRQNGRSFPGAS